jgi:hypothetical protein
LAPKPITVAQAAQAAATVFQSTTVDRILAAHRGTPIDALARWHAMWLWHQRNQATYTATGVAFDRDRTSAADGVKYVSAYALNKTKRELARALQG